jgi:hypothetical protein
MCQTWTHVARLGGHPYSSGEQARLAGAVVVACPINLDQGAALQTGIDFALRDPSMETLTTFDADGQNRLDDAIAMVERLRIEHLDVLIGSRFSLARGTD